MRTPFAKILAVAGLTVALLPAVSLASAEAGAASVPWCGNGDLHASYHATDAATGHRFGKIRLVNVSDHTCRTGGYGGLSYVGHGDGTQIGAPADRVAGRTKAHRLRPGQRVVSRISETVAANYPRRTCHPTHVDGFRVYVPDATRSQYVEHPTTGCRKHQVHLITQKPYRRH